MQERYSLGQIGVFLQRIANELYSSAYVLHRDFAELPDFPLEVSAFVSRAEFERVQQEVEAQGSGLDYRLVPQLMRERGQWLADMADDLQQMIGSGNPSFNPWEEEQ